MKAYFRFAYCCMLLLVIQNIHAQSNLAPQWLAQPDIPFTSGPVTVSDAVTTGNDDTYIIGSYRNGADFDPGRDTFYMKTPYGYSLFLAKYNKMGKLLFAESFSGISDTYYESFNSIAADGAGNVYITGVFGNAFDFDPGPSVVNFPVKEYYHRDMFIAKYDTAGHLVFAKPIVVMNPDSYASSIALDKQNNICIAGKIAGINVDFDPGTAAAYLSGDHKGDCFFAKYDNNGNYLFAKKIEGDANEFPYDVATDSHNNILLTGYYNTGNNDFNPGTDIAQLVFKGSSDLFFAKYSPAGDLIFVKSIGGKNSESASSLVTDKDDNIIIAGQFAGTNADFDPGKGKVLRSAVGASYFTDIFISKYDSLGNFIFVNTAGGNDHDRSASVVLDNIGNLYLTGTISGKSIVFDNKNGNDTLKAAGGNDVFFARYNNTGACIYVGQIGSTGNEAPSNILLTKENNIVITGTYTGKLDFDPSSKTNRLYAPNNTVFFASYTSKGQYLSASNIEVYGFYEDITDVRHIVQDNRGNTYVNGSYQGHVDFDPGPDTVLLTSQNEYFRSDGKTSNGYLDPFFAKYNSNGKLVYVKTFRTSTGEAYMLGLTTDDAQNVYTCGVFWGKINFVPGTDTAICGSNNENIYFGFFAKYDANGNYLFSKIIKMSGEFESIQLDTSKNIYLTGEFSGRVSFNPNDTSDIIVANGSADMVIAKYDSVGNYVFATHVGPAGKFNYLYPYDMKLSSSGRIVVCGTLQGKADFDPGPKIFNLFARPTGVAYFTAAYTSGGDFLFATAADTASKGNSFAYHLATDGDDVIISGRYNGTVDLDPGPKTYSPPSIGGDDAFFIKYNSAGKIQFIHAFVAKTINYNETTINSIAADTSHNIYIAGSYQGKVDFDFGSNTSYLQNGGSYLAKYDSRGNYQVAYGFTPYSPYGRDGSSANGLWINRQNEVLLAGTSTGSLDLDPAEDSLLFHSPVYLHSLFYLVKYKQVSTGSKPELLITSRKPITSFGLNKMEYIDKTISKTAFSK